jgi:hypothetical protein
MFNKSKSSHRHIPSFTLKKNTSINHIFPIAAQLMDIPHPQLDAKPLDQKKTTPNGDLQTSKRIKSILNSQTFQACSVQFDPE